MRFAVWTIIISNFSHTFSPFNLKNNSTLFSQPYASFPSKIGISNLRNLSLRGKNNSFGIKCLHCSHDFRYVANLLECNVSPYAKISSSYLLFTLIMHVQPFFLCFWSYLVLPSLITAEIHVLMRATSPTYLFMLTPFV